MEPKEGTSEALPLQPGGSSSVSAGEEASHAGLPVGLTPLFHNYETSTIVPPRDVPLVILTVLAGGEWRQIEGLFALYGWERVETIVRADLNGLHILPDIVANFWSVVFWGHPLTPRTLLERWQGNVKVGGQTGDRREERAMESGRVAVWLEQGGP